jgi:chromosome partitioning protein
MLIGTRWAGAIRIVAPVLSQQKGGVGKTTVTANLAVVAGEFGAGHGFRVLAVDLDPQSHLTLSLAQRPEPGRSLGELLNSQIINPPSFDDVVIRDVAPGVDLLPGDERALEMAENDIDNDKIGGLTRLKHLLDSVRDRYQLVFIDTPPKVEGLSVVAMVASQGIIIVAEPSSLSFASTRVYAAKVRQVADSPLNPALRVLGVLLNKATTGEEASIVTDALGAMGFPVFETRIPLSKLASKAAGNGVPAALAYRNTEIGKIYRAAADEIIDRLQASALAGAAS